MRELEPAGALGRNGRRRWEDYHRVAFVLVLVSLLCMGIAVFLWMRLPVITPPMSAEQIQAQLDAASSIELYELHKQVEAGLAVTPIINDPTPRIRQSMLWGMGIALALAAGTLACALVVVLNGRKRRS
ncbi:MAG: hypothetical protein DWQ37_13370 [Planctomycetota bacterium]|nr:MAG: hypothetical protein DWQ37_13370 [Planctomycetota bacterium]